MAQNMELETIQIYGDSLLIIHQLLGTYGVKKLELVPYFLKAKELISQFSDVKIEHIIRSQNNKVDALASLAASLSLNSCQMIDIWVEERRILPILSQEEDTKSTSVLAAKSFEFELGDWRTPFLEYLLHGYLPLDSSERSQIRKRSINYTCINDMLYRRSSDGILLHCLAENEVIDALNEVRARVCGAHQSDSKLHYQVKHLGYY
jgi:hypothetical protein